MEGIFN